MKGLLTILAAAAVIVPMSDASASDRLTTHEIKSFVAKFDSALNNPDALVGRSFLTFNLKENVSYENSVRTPWHNVTHHGYNNVYHQENVYSNYYRYPHAYSSSYRPAGLQVEGKTGMISNFLNKKRVVPGLVQETKITNTMQPAEANTAVVDVDLKEFGLRYTGYAGYGYNGYNGYHPSLTQRVLHTNAKCKMYLEKQNQDVRLKRMVCNSNTNLPI